MVITLKFIIMGLFNFGNKALIKSTVLKISTGIAQIEQELQSSNQQVTPMVRGITFALKEEVKQLEALLKPNGQTDWNLINTLIVKVHDGKEIPLETFKARLHNEALFLLDKTGIDIRIWL